MVPLAGGAGLATPVDLLIKIPEPGDFDVLVLRTFGIIFPADNWRWGKKTTIDYYKFKNHLENTIFVQMC